MTTEKARRENRHRANLNNPNNPDFGKGMDQPGIPPQPAQTRAGEGRPDRIDEGRGQALPRGRKRNEPDAPGTVVVTAGPRPAEAASAIADKQMGSPGDIREDDGQSFAAMGSPFAGSAETFFSRVEQSGALPSGISAAEGAAAVLSTLTLRLSGGEVRHLESSLQPEIAQLLHRHALPRGEQSETFGRDVFVQRIARLLQMRDDEAAALARAVLLALRSQLPAKELHDIESQLPSDLVSLGRTKEAYERVREASL